jgi:hypothetical protein
MHEWGLGDSAIAEGGGKLMMALALQKLLWPLRVALTALFTPVLVFFMPVAQQAGAPAEKTD